MGGTGLRAGCNRRGVGPQGGWATHLLLECPWPQAEAPNCVASCRSCSETPNPKP